MVGLEDEGIISGDKDKLHLIFNKFHIPDLTDDILDMVCNRIGKERPGFNRLIKIQLPTSAIRNEMLKNASKLKKLSEPWDKIYIKKRFTSGIFKREPETSKEGG